MRLPLLTAATSVGMIVTAAGQETIPGQVVMDFLHKTVSQFKAQAGETVRSYQISGKVGESRGMFGEHQGGTFSLDFQTPGHFKLNVHSGDMNVTLCQSGSTIWIHTPQKNLCVIGDASISGFGGVAAAGTPANIFSPDQKIGRAEMMMLPVLLHVTTSPNSASGKDYRLAPSPAAAALELPVQAPSLTFTVQENSPWPAVVKYTDAKNALTLLLNPVVATDQPLPEETWLPKPEADDVTERVALSHLQRFIQVSISSLTSRIPSLPPATGERLLVGTAGAGRLEMHDGTRVLFLSGSPAEMGRQHGTLLKPEIRQVVDRILYGVGVGSSFDKGRWFFDEIEEAVRRTTPFIDPRHLDEMDAIAAAAGLESKEVRLANYFPELFHCSGFALLGKASKDGKMYHGRVLDYLRGVGLEENAVVIVSRPDKGHAWVNISYAGFVGSVTAMNEHQLCLGEMGGRGEGNWDGKPMAQLVREVMEQCATIEEAIALMRRTPRTCEYYYVISDAKSQRACGIKATPEIFDVVWTGESHPELADPVADTILMSAGNRYEELVKRVKGGFGTFDAPAARELMSKPVCMNSNIHSVLFAPDSLDFWVANADSKQVASEARYTKYNLKELLTNPPAVAKP